MTFESTNLQPIEQLVPLLDKQGRSYMIRLRRKPKHTVYELKVLTHGS
jgi:hypothetical protein